MVIWIKFIIIFFLLWICENGVYDLILWVKEKRDEEKAREYLKKYKLREWRRQRDREWEGWKDIFDMEWGWLSEYLSDTLKDNDLD